VVAFLENCEDAVSHLGDRVARSLVDSCGQSYTP
jgi:hypothetical protein